MIRRLLPLLALLPALALAQAPVTSVAAAPAGSCSESTDGRVQLVKSTGAIYCCNSGSWGACGGSNADTLDGQHAAEFLDPATQVQTPDLNNPSYGYAMWDTAAVGIPAAGTYGSVLTWNGLGGGTSVTPSGSPQRWIYQIGFDTQNPPRMYTRSSINGAAWSAWGNMLGGAVGIGGITSLTPGDLSIMRPGTPSAGAIWFGNSGARYFWYDGAKFQMYGADLEVSGNVTAYASISDERLKKNIEPIEGALDKAKSIRSVTHEWREEKLGGTGFHPTAGRVSGVIAQDVQKVLPDAIFEAKGDDDETYLGVRYERLVPLLLAAIKELEARVAALEASR